MAIANRDLDTSEQKNVLEDSYALTVTGVTLIVGIVPSAGTLVSAGMAVFGLSGAPAYALRINRFIVGTGATVINPTNNTLVPSDYGTSGFQSFSLLAAGNTLLQLLEKDMITLTTSVANTAVLNSTIALVIQNTQDIKTVLGQ